MQNLSHRSNAMPSQLSLPARIYGFLAAVIHPLLPAMLGSAAVRVLVTFSTAFGLLSDGDPTYTVLQAVGDAFFYFFPILLAYSIAKRQGSSQPLAILVAAILLHPDLSALLVGGGAAFLRIPIPVAIYPASVLPVLLPVLLMKPVERIAERLSPDPLKGFLKPLLVLLTIVPLSLLVIGPAVSFVGDRLTEGFHFLYGKADWLAILLLSLLMPLLILCGLHHRVVDPDDIVLWSAALLSATLALCGIALAALRSRDKTLRQTALGASVSALAGIPEPAVYGTALRGFPLLAASVSAGAGGLYAALTGVAATGDGSTSPIFALIHAASRKDYGDLIHLSIALLIPLGLALGLGLLIYRSPARKERHRSFEPSVQAFAPKDSVPTGQATGEEKAPAVPISFVSPLSGRVIPLSQVSDPAFASGVMGQGCAILPDLGKVYAPCDGTVSSVCANGNSLSIDSREGVQLFIHIGRDTAKLSADHFDLCCRAGDPIRQGDLLLSFDADALRKAGIDLTTPLLVVNADRYDDLSLTCESKVKVGDRLLTLTPKV